MEPRMSFKVLDELSAIQWQKLTGNRIKPGDIQKIDESVYITFRKDINRIQLAASHRNFDRNQAQYKYRFGR